MKSRAPLLNPVLPTKLYDIFDHRGREAAQVWADSASAALRQARTDFGTNCRAAILSKPGSQPRAASSRSSILYA